MISPALVPIQALSTLAAVRTMPLVTTRIGHTQRAGPAELVDDVCDRLGNCRRGGWLRCKQLETVADQLPGIEVDDSALDAAAADVDSESAALRCGIRCHRNLLGEAWLSAHLSLASPTS